MRVAGYLGLVKTKGVIMKLLIAAIASLIIMHGYYLNAQTEFLTQKVKALESRVNELTLRSVSGDTNIYKPIRCIKRSSRLKEK
jgi:hypothetical protein